MGRRSSRKGRDVSGILLLDKPAGLSSNQALQRVRFMFDARKGGHTGSLDPIATGMLPLCLGEATKFSGYLLDSDKRYRVVAALGSRTETGDREGAVIDRRPVPEITRSQVQELLDEHFTGDIEQMPPMYSALKRDGVPLYKYARRGEEVEREKRTVCIHEAQVTSVGDGMLGMEISCSKGTYIRTLVEDLGELLGCGAHVSELRRVAVGPYRESAMLTVEALESALETGGTDALDGFLLPVDSSVEHWPGVDLSTICTEFVRKGQSVRVPDLPEAGPVRLRGLSDDNERFFLGIGEVLGDGRVAPRRLVRLG